MERRRWYSSFVAQYPSVVILTVLFLLVACGLGAFLGAEIPSFKDPGKGFEPRGTEIKKRSQTITNIKNATEKGILLNSIPVGIHGHSGHHHNLSVRGVTSRAVGRHISGSGGQNANGLELCSASGFSSILKIVFKADFVLDDIKAMCEFSSTFIHERTDYDTICREYSDTSMQNVRQCCPDISIGNVIASTFHRESCMHLNESDITAMKLRLSLCAPWYSNHTLTRNCSEVQMQDDSRATSSHPCLKIPHICTENNAVYNILHYLTDIRFVDDIATVCKSSWSSSCSLETIDHFPSLQYAVLLLQAGGLRDTSKADRQWLLELYNDHLASTEHYKGVTVAGFDLHINYLVFQQRLLSESLFPSFSLLLVFVIMWVYTGSFFITSMACLAIISSIIITYFIYMIVFQVPSFGFLNLLALIIVIGVGADDVFVYVDVWRQTKAAIPRATMTEWVSRTLRHAALSMFVTSFTTAVAFFANIVSPITAIKTFGIFAGTAILSNYILMISWLPAIVVVYERYLSSLCCKKENGSEGRLNCIHHIATFARRAFNLCYERYLSKVIITLRYPFALGLAGLAVGMAFAVFFKPQLQLPSTERFQFFVPSDPLSSYILDLQNHFYFEKARDAEGTIPLYLFWGIAPLDAGNAFDPDDKPLVLDYQWPKPFVINEEIQQWFLDFCEAIKEEDFYRSTITCFPTEFQLWQKSLLESSRTCSNYTGDWRICCNVSLPTDWETLNRCLKLSTVDIYTMDSEWYGVKYDKDGDVRAITAKIESDQFFTRSVAPMESLWNEVENFMVKSSSSAPDGLGRGWFSGWFDFMDLQKSLVKGTLISMGVSLGCSFAVLFLTTLNIVISLYAIVSIGGVLLSTVGTLVLLGWELGIFESVTIAIAVGLSVDFTVHFGVAYRLCCQPKRQERTVYALNHMGPALTMAALTTFVAGSVMMPATILTYFQLGVFLMLIMVYSWVFANFFFLPICAIGGPQNRFAQVSLPASLDCYGKSVSNPGQQDNTETAVDGQSPTLQATSNRTLTSESAHRKRKMAIEINDMTSVPSASVPADHNNGSTVKGIVTFWASSV